MKPSALAFAMLLLVSACGSNQVPPPADQPSLGEKLGVSFTNVILPAILMIH